MILSAHQPNFIPPFSYFVKMAASDTFVIMGNVQFSKTGFQNYQVINGNRWTNPVRHGNVPINEKMYTTGDNLSNINTLWIRAMAKTLGIKTKMVSDFMSNLSATERLIELCQHYGCDGYLANASAPDKYLDIELLESAGITFIPLVCPEKRHTFEMFNQYGIDKTRNIMNEYAKHTRSKVAITS